MLLPTGGVRNVCPDGAVDDGNGQGAASPVKQKRRKIGPESVSEPRVEILCAKRVFFRFSIFRSRSRLVKKLFETACYSL